MLTQKLVLGRRPDVYIPGQATYAYILRYWYLVPLIKPPWAAVLITVLPSRQLTLLTARPATFRGSASITSLHGPG